MRGLYLLSVWLHVLAAMTWMGGMVVFVAAVMPIFRAQGPDRRTDLLNAFGPRFQRISWICFAVLVTTGTANLAMRGVRLADFLRPEWRATPFGQYLILKLGLVAAALIVSAVHERTTTRAQALWLGRATFALGLAIVAVAVMLVRAL